ncbi:hypothetical protein [Pandoraea sputorum]|uniref:Uncharacterized protein n=1 Tax=Pandoraea sputorum TaxID=93222 RepID=A0A239SNZ0_9BURK|nr:hypothetical protein [Pandoraea sputorum]SNU86972.1 Uncharacterised protein [Pandoraea sputorum]VVE23383.1 hypothetical protein PSP20601_03269 [Pandoraea sputorum]
MLSTALTVPTSANMCSPIDQLPPHPMCPMRTEMSQDFSALQQTVSSALQPWEPTQSICTCAWFTDRITQMRKNEAAFHAATSELTRKDDARALRARDLREFLLVHLVSMPTDAEVDRALRGLIHDINHRSSAASVDDVCERHFGRSLMRDIQQWLARNEQICEERRQRETTRQFVAGLVAVVVLGRERVAAAIRFTVGALQAFRWAGTGRDPQNAIARHDPGAPRPGAGD